MITYEEAIEIIDRHAAPLGSERVFTGAARGRFLAENLVAKVDSPPFDNSAVDGYGRRIGELDTPRLRLAAKLKAGDKGSIKIPPGHCAQIFTGAPVPGDIAAVTMQEDCERDGETVIFHEGATSGQHVRRAGEDFHRGDVVLNSGTYIGPAQIGIAVSSGNKELTVTKAPTVHVLTSGTELLDIEHELIPWKIFNSNLFTLSSAIEGITDECRIYTSSDRPDVLRKRMSAAIMADVVITSGGVSVGEYDLLRDEFAFWGVEQQFWRVAIKPGMPVYFGILEDRLVFGLPGNPVSALVTYYLFARPAILKLMGHPDPWPKPLQARFEGSRHKKPGRLEFLRGTLSHAENVVREAGEQGSHQMAGMAAANCLVHFPREASELKSGEVVEVTPLRWGIE